MPALDWLWLILGTLIGVGALLADIVGVGAFPGIGWKQVSGTIVGILMVAVGALRIIRRDRNSQS